MILHYKEISIEFDRLLSSGHHDPYVITVTMESNYLIGATDLYVDTYDDIYDGNLNVVDDYENTYTGNYE